MKLTPFDVFRPRGLQWPSKNLCRGCNVYDWQKDFKCIKGLKIKNTEGYDRIPQRIIIDGGMVLCWPLENLF